MKKEDSKPRKLAASRAFSFETKFSATEIQRVDGQNSNNYVKYPVSKEIRTEQVDSK